MEPNKKTNSPPRDQTSNQTSIEEIVMRIHVLEMNMTLFSNQVNNQLSNYATSISSLSNSLSQLLSKVNDLEKQFKELQRQVSHDSPLSKSESIKSVNQPSSSKSQASSSPTFLQIAQKEKSQENQEAQSKEKIVSSPKSPVQQTISLSRDPSRNPRSQKSKLIEQFQYLHLLIYKLNLCQIPSETIKYISHYAINKAIIYPATNPELVKTLYSYGLIQCIYPSSNLQELSLLPKNIQEAAGHYAGIITQYSMYIRCYSTIAEITPDKYYLPINLIKFGTTKKPFEVEETIKELIEDEDLPSMISRIRAQEMETIFAEMNRTISSKEAQLTYFTGPTTCIFSVGRQSRQSRQFSMFYDKVKTNNFDHPEDTKRRICQQLS